MPNACPSSRVLHRDEEGLTYDQDGNRLVYHYGLSLAWDWMDPDGNIIGRATDDDLDAMIDLEMEEL